MPENVKEYNDVVSFLDTNYKNYLFGSFFNGCCIGRISKCCEHPTEDSMFKFIGFNHLPMPKKLTYKEFKKRSNNDSLFIDTHSLSSEKYLIVYNYLKWKFEDIKKSNNLSRFIGVDGNGLLIDQEIIDHQFFNIKKIGFDEFKNIAISDLLKQDLSKKEYTAEWWIKNIISDGEIRQRFLYNLKLASINISLRSDPREVKSATQYLNNRYGLLESALNGSFDINKSLEGSEFWTMILQTLGNGRYNFKKIIPGPFNSMYSFENPDLYDHWCFYNDETSKIIKIEKNPFINQKEKQQLNNQTYEQEQRSPIKVNRSVAKTSIGKTIRGKSVSCRTKKASVSIGPLSNKTISVI